MTLTNRQLLCTLLVACPSFNFLGSGWTVTPLHRFSPGSTRRASRPVRLVSTKGIPPDDPFSDGNTQEKPLDNVVAQPPGDAVAFRYDLGLGKNRPVGTDPDPTTEQDVPPTIENVTNYWLSPELIQVKKPNVSLSQFSGAVQSDGFSAIKTSSSNNNNNNNPPQDLEFVSKRKMVARDQASQRLRGAVWDEGHFSNSAAEKEPPSNEECGIDNDQLQTKNGVKRPLLFYPNIDMSIPDTVYNESYDALWELLRWEAYEEAQREPLLTSYLWSTILNHKSMETSLAFLLANRLSSPMLISTQLQSFILEALDASPEFRRAVRADMLAVRDRDPACGTLVDVYLYFKGFSALQAHRVAHFMWKNGKTMLAHYIQSAVSNQMQIDIHPNATLGQGLMLDHGTGIVVGETAMIGNNCSILHHVTLGGSGKKGVDRHPKVRDGVLLGAGATVLGNVVIGEGSQVGAGTLVISDLPPHCVAVGVPAKIIGSFIDVTEQPSNDMNQMIGDNMKIATFESYGI